MDFSWIFESIVNWVASIVTSIMDAVSGIFLNALGTDMTAMEQYFPFVTEAFSIFQYTAWALLFLITVWQLFRVFGGPVTEAENPWQLLVRSTIFAILIGYAKPIFLLALDIARAPYTALMDATMDPGSFTFAGVEQVLTNGLSTMVSTITVVGPLLTIILMISLGWNYFKMLLECVERYVVVGVLCYTSPLAFSMGGSKTTNNVFKGWTRMVGSQLLLLVLNVWFLRAFNSTVGQFIGNGGALSTGQGSIFLWMFVALAFLKTAQKFDSYLAAMGLNVAQTGSSMGMELLMAARVISGVASGGARTAGSVFRGANGTAGASGTSATSGGFFAGFASRFKPNSYVRDAVVEGGTHMGAGGSAGFVARAFGGMAARNGATLSSESIASVAARPGNVSGTIAGEIADRSTANYMPQLQGYSLSCTEITGGRISTVATGADGKTSEVEMLRRSSSVRPCRTPPSRHRMVASGIKRLPAMAQAASIHPRHLPVWAWEKRFRRIRSAQPLAILSPRVRRFALWGIRKKACWRQVIRIMVQACGTTAPCIRSRMLLTIPSSPWTASVGMPCSRTTMCRSLNRQLRRQKHIIRRSSGPSCPAMKPSPRMWIHHAQGTALSTCGMRTAVPCASMTIPSSKRPAATIPCMRTSEAVSGMRYPVRLLWSGGPYTKAVSPYMTAIRSRPRRWRLYDTRAR